ncbi:MAG TPA: hypothetical protein VN914_20165 [Polyangia bacterium]|nr:hypothetical protein [Polyangia bacterium]
MLFRIRKLLAVFLMAVSGGGIVALLSRDGLDRGSIGFIGIIAALAVGTLALARGVWWGRLLPMGWSLAVAMVSSVAAADGAPFALHMLAGAVLLRACLAGREMFSRYEGAAPPPMDWTRRGMRLVRVAVEANLCAFLGAVAFAPDIYRFSSSRFPAVAGLDPTVLLVGCLAMTAVMLVGVILLARLRTAGLLLVAVAAVGIPLIVLGNRDVLAGRGGYMMAAVFGPGLVCGWLALFRFLPGMVRLLRR